jgi:hypothetical protein
VRPVLGAGCDDAGGTFRNRGGRHCWTLKIVCVGERTVVEDTLLSIFLLSFLCNLRVENEEDVVENDFFDPVSVMLVTSSQQVLTSFFEVVQKLDTSYWSEAS